MNRKSSKIVNLKGKRVKCLPTKEVVYFTVGDWEFDQFIRQVFDQSFCFAADREGGHDTVHELSGDGRLSDYDMSCVENFIATGEGNYMAAQLLNYCIFKGWLPTGKYLVKVT